MRSNFHGFKFATDESSLYEHILGLKAPWFVEHVDLNPQKNCVTVHVNVDDQAMLVCPECGKEAPRHDTRTRRWRHLDTCQLETIVEAEAPRIHFLISAPTPVADSVALRGTAVAASQNAGISYVIYWPWFQCDLTA